MHSDAGKRYTTAAEFAEELERLLSRQPIRARRAGLVTRGLRTLRRQRPSRMILALLVAVIVLSALCAWLTLQQLG